MNELQPIAESATIGYVMLGLAAIFTVCSICDFLESRMKRLAEKRGFSNPQLNELMESYRMMGMRASTYSFVKGVFFAGLLGITIYAGKPAMSNVLAGWLG